MNLVEALQDPKAFGALPAFRNLRTWRSWLTFLAAFYGLPLDDEQEQVFKRHTGLDAYAPPEGGWRQAVVIVGRQGGKSRIAALVAGFEAIVASPEPDSTTLYSLLVTQDSSAALRTLWSYATAPFEDGSPLRQRVVSQTKRALILDSELVLAAYPCDPTVLRGLRSQVVVLDDLAFYLSGAGALIDRELMSAVRPSLATTNGRLLVLSAPSADGGVLLQMRQDHFGKSGSRVLVWQASAADMNPTLSTEHLDRMREDDPQAYRLEVLAEFPGTPPREEAMPAPPWPDAVPPEVLPASLDLPESPIEASPPPIEASPPPMSPEPEHVAHDSRVTRCCYCGSREVHPSVPRTLKERLFFALSIGHPYRCRRCGGRYAAITVGSRGERRRRHRTKARLRKIQRWRALRQWLVLLLAVFVTVVVVWYALQRMEQRVPDEPRPIETPVGG